MNPNLKLGSVVAGIAAASTLLLGWGLRPGRHPIITEDGAQTGTAMAGAAMPLPDAAITPLKDAFVAYDRIRAHLAQDQVAGLSSDAAALIAALQAARHAVPSGDPVVATIDSLLSETGHLAAAASIDDAREHFANLSHGLISIAETEPRLQTGQFVFLCPMTKGYKKWVQESPTLANPYLGTMMSTCGNATTWMADEKPAPGPAMANADTKGIAFWTCSMHPSVKQQTPGKCPICGMDLIVVTTAQVATGEITITEQRRQVIGVRTETIAKQAMTIPVQVVGRVAYDETGYVDVSLKVSGFVTQITADSTGMFVQKGQPLFNLYSPDLYAAEQEYVLTLHAHPNGDAILTAAEDRLRLWDLTDAQIAEISDKGAQKIEVITAPASGYVLTKDLVQGSAVMAGQRLYRIAPIERVWVLAQIFETDLAVVHPGLPVTVALTYLPGQTFAGSIDYLYPGLDEDTRSARARIVLDNVDHHLKPDMYATVSITVDAGEKLLVPKSAVIYTGPRRLVFVDKGEGRLRPQQVKLGLANEQFYEVLSGLDAGDKVVVSGNFLVAAESRIRSAEQYWGGDNDSK